MTRLAAFGASALALAALTNASITAQDVSRGAALFAQRCADCHAADATGAVGPDLTALWTSGATDERIFQSIRLGVPGSVMPPTAAPDEEIRAIIAHLKTLTPARTPAARSEER